MKKIKSKNYKYNPNEWDDSKSEKVIPERRIISGVSTSIRLPKEMITKLKKVAKQKGDVGYQTLLKIWIAERLDQELRAKR
ncbi:CopG family antitoxin [uncultured Bdellovibrio sp.]|uniref:CopG family antitoxin n=1 Tax=Bdellovibrio sp. HCB-162 TaxID=3394234 RepID=UPI0025F195FB|nr:CopG family antitoxin [uncultured Bdellovibrio sp.]